MILMIMIIGVMIIITTFVHACVRVQIQVFKIQGDEHSNFNARFRIFLRTTRYISPKSFNENSVGVKSAIMITFCRLHVASSVWDDLLPAQLDLDDVC